MQFTPTGLEGSWLIEPAPHRDRRGTFTRTFCADAFRRHGLEAHFPQQSIAVTAKCGTLRGLHLQRSPHEEVKLVRCVAGAVYNVIVDLRAASRTFGAWRGYELTASNGHQIYVPKGFAQGCQSVTDDASVLYLISEPYVAEMQTGVRYDDPALAITWPLPVTEILERDRNWPGLERWPRVSRSGLRIGNYETGGIETVGSTA